MESMSESYLDKVVLKFRIQRDRERTNTKSPIWRSSDICTFNGQLSQLFTFVDKERYSALQSRFDPDSVVVNSYFNSDNEVDRNITINWDSNSIENMKPLIPQKIE